MTEHSTPDAIDATEIAARFGTPCMIWDESALRAAARGAQRAMSKLFGTAGIVAFAVKCAPVPAILATFNKCELWADVAWPRERILARNAGVTPERTLNTGPFKPPDVIRTVVAAGEHLYLETPGQVSTAVAMTDKGLPLSSVALRIRPDSATRFGLDPDEAATAASALSAAGVDVVGLHTHFYRGWPPQPAAFVERYELLCAAVDRMKLDNLRYLDLGGGIAEPEQAYPDEEMYADRILDSLGKVSPAHTARFGSTGPAVVIEPGRFLVQHAGTFVASVIDVRDEGCGRRTATLDAGLCSLASMSSTAGVLRWHPSRRAAAEAGSHTVTVFGPSCMEQDSLGQIETSQIVETGDLVVLDRAGAYQWAHRSGFAEDPPRQVWVDEDRYAVSLDKPAD